MQYLPRKEKKDDSISKLGLRKKFRGVKKLDSVSKCQ